MMPENYLENIKKKLTPQWKLCFLSVIAFGLIAHNYKITNWIPNWDSLVFRHDPQDMIGMGRWFLHAVCSPSSFYDLPFVTGFIAIFFFGLGALCICSMFSVKKNTTAVLIGALVVTFPSVTSVMFYSYVADGYAISFFFACLAAVYMTKKKVKYYIAAAILIAFSVGIYQAYITVTIVLLLAYLIIEILYGGAQIKSVLAKCIRFFVTGLCGMVLYYLILQAILLISGVSLLDYQGFGDAANFSSIDILASLYNIKNAFIGYFFDFSDGFNLFCFINCIIFALMAVMYLADVKRRKIGFLKFAFICVFVALLPFGANILAFINCNIDYHNLMKMGYFVFYLLFVLLYEHLESKSEVLNVVKAWLVFGVAAFMVLKMIIIANVGYHKLEIAYEKSFGTLIRIADRIEQTEEIDGCSRILVIGALEGSEAYSSDLPPDLTGTTDSYILRKDDEMVGQSVLCSALNDYCGKNYDFVAGEEKKSIMETEYVKNMDYWPGKNSIGVSGDVIVIKLGAEK